MALHLDLVPADRVGAVVANLIEDIRVRHNGHLTTGIIGTAALENALPRYGQAEVMAELVAQTTFPSWGEQIAKGATTVWESWNGDPEDELSLNMKMFCSTEVFFYRTLAGISPISPGYRTIAIRPNLVGGLTEGAGRRDGHAGGTGPACTLNTGHWTRAARVERLWRKGSADPGIGARIAGRGSAAKGKYIIARLTAGAALL